MKVKVTQSCPALFDSIDYTIHRLLQARILEWVAFPFSSGSSWPCNQTKVSCIWGRFFFNWAIREPQISWRMGHIYGLSERNTWNNRQIWHWSTEWSRKKASRVLPREHTGHSKHSQPITQERMLHMDITKWSIPKSGWLCSLKPKMEKLYTVSKNKTRSWLLLRSWTPYSYKSNSDLN